MSLYEMFTERARRVIQLANQEGQRFGHEIFDAHHVLLGLMKESSGVAAHALEQFTNLRSLRYAVAELFPAGSDVVGVGRLPETDEVRLAVKEALQWAQKLDHRYCNTEHLLLGLLEGSNNAVRVLQHLHISIEAVRQEVFRLLGHGLARVVPEDSLICAEVLFLPEQVNVYPVSCTDSLASDVFDPHDRMQWIVQSWRNERLFASEFFARCGRGI